MSAQQITLPSLLRGRELRIERGGQGYSVAIVAITGGDHIADIAASSLSLSASYSAHRVDYALLATGNGGGSVANIHLNARETEQLADWLDLPVPCAEASTP